MGIRVFISGISGNKEVKKRQQRVLLILDSKNIKYDVVDIAEPGSEEDKDFMQNNSASNGATISDPNPRHPLPPQIFNDDVYCGDYDAFDMANEIDEMEIFLKLAPDDSAPAVTSSAEIKLENGSAKKDEEEPEISNDHVDSTNQETEEEEDSKVPKENQEEEKVENGNQDEESGDHVEKEVEDEEKDEPEEDTKADDS